ncbi:DNA-binding protein [Pseudomonas sp. gcc21]|uniref:phage antirepressor KilAC domain-containing protein n=1 Tax=Pseudomonas sp. gcc21 TaxID=2726989 RepID=UPI001451AC69|nr:phage antirepressor KilAC domain-containing protein [Pseudomonas sp. gcc21]QJD58177.1 DNA-binding protein [Pseudomonas sp. gcc21]
MNTMIKATHDRASRSSITLSSSEIAGLVGKRHDNVKRTIETLAEQGVITFPQIEEKPSTGGRPSSHYLFTGDQGKRDSIVVVAQLSPEFTARLVDRWQELEANQLRIPQTLPEALRLAADLADEVTSLRLVTQEQAPKIAALNRLATARGTLCMTDAAKHLGVQRKVLLEWMQVNRWIYRREGCAHWLGYQPRLAAGLLEHKVTVLGSDEGLQRLASQVRVTPKGLAELALKVGGLS